MKRHEYTRLPAGRQEFAFGSREWSPTALQPWFHENPPPLCVVEVRLQSVWRHLAVALTFRIHPRVYTRGFLREGG